MKIIKDIKEFVSGAYQESFNDFLNDFMNKQEVSRFKTFKCDVLGKLARRLTIVYANLLLKKYGVENA